MKEIKLIVTEDGKIIEEFGGDLEGVCCGNESRKIQEEFKKYGVELLQGNVFCFLPQTMQAEAKSNGLCTREEV